MSIIKILIQLMRFNPKDMINYFLTSNSVYVKIINGYKTLSKILELKTKK